MNVNSNQVLRHGWVFSSRFLSTKLSLQKGIRLMLKHQLERLPKYFLNRTFLQLKIILTAHLVIYFDTSPDIFSFWLRSSTSIFNFASTFLYGCRRTKPSECRVFKWSDRIQESFSETCWCTASLTTTQASRPNIKDQGFILIWCWTNRLTGRWSFTGVEERQKVH